MQERQPIRKRLESAHLSLNVYALFLAQLVAFIFFVIKCKVGIRENYTNLSVPLKIYAVMLLLLGISHLIYHAVHCFKNKEVGNEEPRRNQEFSYKKTFKNTLKEYLSMEGMNTVKMLFILSIIVLPILSLSTWQFLEYHHIFDDILMYSLASLFITFLSATLICTCIMGCCEYLNDNYKSHNKRNSKYSEDDNDYINLINEVQVEERFSNDGNYLVI